MVFFSYSASMTAVSCLASLGSLVVGITMIVGVVKIYRGRKALELNYEFLIMLGMGLLLLTTIMSFLISNMSSIMDYREIGKFDGSSYRTELYAEMLISAVNIVALGLLALPGLLKKKGRTLLILLLVVLVISIVNDLASIPTKVEIQEELEAYVDELDKDESPLLPRTEEEEAVRQEKILSKLNSLMKGLIIHKVIWWILTAWLGIVMIKTASIISEEYVMKGRKTSSRYDYDFDDEDEDDYEEDDDDEDDEGGIDEEDDDDDDDEYVEMSIIQRLKKTK